MPKLVAATDVMSARSSISEVEASGPAYAAVLEVYNLPGFVWSGRAGVIPTHGSSDPWFRLRDQR